MTPIERAARALCYGHDADDVNGGPHPSGIWLDPGEAWWTGYADEVRTVIEALREPSEGMKSIGGLEGDWNRATEEWHGALAGNVWQAMIDAALEGRV